MTRPCPPRAIQHTRLHAHRPTHPPPTPQPNPPTTRQRRRPVVAHQGRRVRRGRRGAPHARHPVRRRAVPRKGHRAARRQARELSVCRRAARRAAENGAPGVCARGPRAPGERERERETSGRACGGRRGVGLKSGVFPLCCAPLSYTQNAHTPTHTHKTTPKKTPNRSTLGSPSSAATAPTALRCTTSSLTCRLRSSSASRFLSSSRA